MRHSALILASVGGLIGTQIAAAQFAGTSPSSGAISSGVIPAQSRMPLGSTAADMKIEGTSFGMKMAISDMFEIESSNLALDRSKSNDIKAFARMMTQDHAQSTEKLKDAYRKSAILDPLPNKLDQEHSQKMSRLLGLSGTEFDRAYMIAQIEGHQQAITMLQAYSQMGDQPALKMFATEALPTVQRHLGEAERLETPASAAQ